MSWLSGSISAQEPPPEDAAFFPAPVLPVLAWGGLGFRGWELGVSAGGQLCLKLFELTNVMSPVSFPLQRWRICTAHPCWRVTLRIVAQPKRGRARSLKEEDAFLRYALSLTP